jgi:MoaA/NifB/PqqE/SkfB family radical SAM enzyme
MFNQKILCLGNNDESTDRLVSALAQQDSTTNHGLIVTDNVEPVKFGYYHTTVLDIPYGGIVELSKKFDKVIFLDQSLELWSNWKPFLSTYRLIVEIEKQGQLVQYKDNDNIKKLKNFADTIADNKSFCIYPWINYVEEDGKLRLCARSGKSIGTPSGVVNWQSKAEYQEVRQKMIAGEKLPDHCHTCYFYESKGIESYRMFETKEWVTKLGITSIEDLENISHPYYYELRLSNKCNLMCRGCNPGFSHRIDEEFKKFNIVHPSEFSRHYSSIDIIDIDTLNPMVRVYLTGGDPTVIPEVYTFMERCIAAGRTDFEFTLGINGQKISQRFLKLTDHFSNLNFSISLDGYGRVNDYWRWGSDFDTIIKNTKLLQSRGHNISINTVPGIYNITNLHLLYEFLDQEFPNTSVYSQINYLADQSPYNHPNAELCLESLSKCRQTKMYLSDGKSNKTAIDSLYDHYSKNPTCDLASLKKFFDYNDQLDRARNSKLCDYIPELEECRQLLIDK